MTANADIEIVDLLRNGDENGLNKMFERYYKPLVVFSFGYVNSLAEAEDIVQDLFICFWDDKKIINLSGSLKSYLFTSVKNASLNSLKRKNSSYIEDIDRLENNLIDEISGENELDLIRQQLYSEIEKLSPRSKAVFKAIVMENMKYKEVAEALGVSINTVKTLFSRSLRKLKGSINHIVLLML